MHSTQLALAHNKAALLEMKLAAVVHSHSNNSLPSEADRANAESMGIPWIIAVLRETDLECALLVPSRD